MEIWYQSPLSKANHGQNWQGYPEETAKFAGKNILGGGRKMINDVCRQKRQNNAYQKSGMQNAKE